MLALEIYFIQHPPVKGKYKSIGDIEDVSLIGDIRLL